MRDGTSESEGATPKTPQIDAGNSIPEKRTAVSSVHGVAARERGTHKKGPAVALLKGLANVVFMALLIYLTYFFTLLFSKRPPAPAPVSESDRVAAKKIEELRAQDRALLTSYGPVDPTTRAARIPIDEAMKLIVAESSQPAPAKGVAPTPAPPPATTTAAAPTTPKANAVATTAKAAAPAASTASPPPATPLARVGMAPAQLYRAICIACHDVDGRGTIVRKAMPAIPDLTDAKWLATRTDADLLQSVLVGKGQFMLPMKEKFELAGTDPKEMVAFMRSFQSGKHVDAAAPGTSGPATSTAPLVAAPGLTAPTAAAPAAAPASGPGGPAVPSVSLVPASATAPTSPTPVGSLAMAGAPANVATAPRTSARSVVGLAPTTSLTGTPSTATSPARAAKLRVAGEFYNNNCLACHGPDGRGTAIRAAMPLIPDFTSRNWQMSHDNPQLAVSILEGKSALMPPWRGKIDPALAQDLVGFVRTFGPADLVLANRPTSEFGTRLRQLRQQIQELDRQTRALSGP
jgi:mono/diheme cytochrome c family protein